MECGSQSLPKQQIILRKQMRKQVSCHEKKPKFGKLGLVYKVQRCLATHTSLENKKFFPANSTRPVQQVLLEIHLSEISEYSSWMGR